MKEKWDIEGQFPFFLNLFWGELIIVCSFHKENAVCNPMIRSKGECRISIKLTEVTITNGKMYPLADFAPRWLFISGSAPIACLNLSPISQMYLRSTSFTKKGNQRLLWASSWMNVSLCLCSKTSLQAKPFIWKWVWFAWKWTCGGKLYEWFCT